MNKKFFKLNRFEEEMEKTRKRIDAGEELTKMERIAHKIGENTERRDKIQTQNLKIVMTLMLGGVVFGAISAANTQISFILAAICLMISVSLTVISHIYKKKERVLSFKFSNQLWYLNIILELGIIVGIGTVATKYNYEIDTIVTVLLLLNIVFMIITSYIIYSATHEKKKKVDETKNTYE